MQEIIVKGISIIEEKLARDNRHLLYLVISGSHAWGLQREDSDIDFRGIYQESTMKILGLHKGRDTIELSEGIYDYQIYEIEKFLNMLVKHNGNMVNLLWIPQPIVASEKIPWTSLSKKFLTKKLRHYYKGYAESQRKRAMHQRGGKALIYTYREMFAGLYTMRYGELEHEFKKLWAVARNNGWYNGDLLGRYMSDSSQEITDGGWHRFYEEWEELCIKLDEEAEQF